MINYYKVINENKAIKLLSEEIGIEYRDLKKRIETDPKSHIQTITHGIS